MQGAALDIFLPVMESAIVLAAHYCKAAGRSCVQGEDMRLGLMFAVRNVTGKQIGSIYPEVYEESDSGEEDEDEDEESQWTRYEGSDDEMAAKMNECADTWDSWDPESPAERALKNAVDKQRQD